MWAGTQHVRNATHEISETVWHDTIFIKAKGGSHNGRATNGEGHFFLQ